MKLAGIVFYHPKNPQNLLDVASIAAIRRVPLYVVKRPGQLYEIMQRPGLHVEWLEDIEELRDHVQPEDMILVLETYGLRYLHETDLASAKRLWIVVGAEDYGIPPDEAARLPGRRVVAKIPIAVQGMSYNVVVSLSIAVYEAERQARKAREESP